MKPHPRSPLYGLVAEFTEPKELEHAAESTVKAGYTRLEVYSPIPIEGLDDLLPCNERRVPLFTLIGGIIGGTGGFFMQWYASVIHYPINVGGRPLDSWPAFVPVVFELTILGAAIATVLGMLGLNGLPQPYHPLFNVDRFQFASRDRFFLCIESADPNFEKEKTRTFLDGLHPKGVYEVEQ